MRSVLLKQLGASSAPFPAIRFFPPFFSTLRVRIRRQRKFHILATTCRAKEVQCG